MDKTLIWPLPYAAYMKTVASRTATIPKEWIHAVQKLDLFDEMVRAPRDGGNREAVWRLHMNGFVTVKYEEDSWFYDEEAFEICRMYLGTVDRNLWPILMGIHPAMDRALDRKFKKE